MLPLNVGVSRQEKTDLGNSVHILCLQLTKNT